jgi:RNA polymerase sigma-70 factor (ECF subfamily)
MIFSKNTYRDDQNLLRRALEGDAESTRELVSMLSSPAYSLAWKMLNNQNDAEDIVQEAFIRLWKGAAEFNGRSKLLTYFYSIVRNLCLDKLRVRHKDFFEEYDETKHRLDDQFNMTGLETYESRDLQNALSSLSPKQRAALLMWAYEEKTAQQIGEVLGANKNAIDQLLYRAKLKLKSELEGARGNDE